MPNLLIISFVLFLCIVNAVRTSYVVPDVTVEALKNGSFRAYIPDSKSLSFFAFHAKLNAEIPPSDPGDFSMEVTRKTGDYWIATFPEAHLKIGDHLYYWIFLHVNRLGYGKNNANATIAETLNEYPELKSRCIKAHSIINGREACVGEVILDEQFQETQIDDTKWVKEHWIPTYSPPSFIFNYYLNQDDTRFIKNGILYLKPIAIQGDAEVRGTLDIRNGCTSKNEKECYVRSKSWVLLPPAKSAKITSKTSFKYGKIHIRAKLPAGEWIFPVIRLEQKDKENGDNSPVVWIAYSRGNEQLNGYGQDFGSRVVYGGPVLYQIEPLRSQHLVSNRSINPFYQEFHEYSLDWRPGKMIFSIDNVEYGSVDLSNALGSDMDTRGIWSSPEAPYNKEYVLSLGVAVGGITDFPDDYTSGSHTKPWSNGEPKFIKEFFDQREVWSSTWAGDNSALQVDYVKVTSV